VSDKPSFFVELKRRNVYKVAVAYAVVGWLIAQIATQIFPFLEIPNWIVRLVIVLIAIGFPIALVIAWAFEATPEGIKRTEVADAMSATAGHKKHAWIYIVVIGAAISVALVFFGRYTAQAPRPASDSLRRGEQSEAATVSLAAKSIAVLPFDNLSEDKANAYFAEGVQDEILTRLAKVADLKVISRTSTQHFRSAPDNLPQIAKQLGVTNILEGSVQKANDQVRVNVQLINALTDAHLWAEIYDRKLTDIFAVESDIAKTIADTLQAKLTGSEKSAIAKKPTANPEAYELYLKGRFFWNKRTAADLRKAIGYFNQAIEKDPNYALAYSGLADSYVILSVFGAASPQDSIPQARVAAKKALELDDTLAEAHASSGRILGPFDFEFERSISEFERAIELNPNYAMAHHWLSWGPLTALGQVDRAIAEGKRAVELDPLSLINNADLGGNVYFNSRRYDEAIAQLRKTIEIDPRFYIAHYYLGQAFQLKGQLSEAITEYQKAVDLDDDPEALAYLGQAYARAGQRDEAQNILARLTEEAKSRYVSGYSMALMFMGLGDKEQAIDALERAYQEGAGNDLFTIKVDPMLDDLRGQPRFEALAEKVLPARKFKSATALK
jgi:TolB-like protein/Tfp pilus assembly protein PilF